MSPTEPPHSLGFRFFNWETEPGPKPTVATGVESSEASRFTSLSGFPFPWVSPTTDSEGELLASKWVLHPRRLQTSQGKLALPFKIKHSKTLKNS